MTLSRLVPDGTPAPFDIQDTTFSEDVLGRYVCNTWAEVMAAQGAGGYPFDAIVIGSGMFGAYCAEKLYRRGASQAFRILVLDAGAYVLPSHVQNLPQRLGGTIGGSPLRTRDTGTQNAIWGMPWISNQGFPGLAYAIGGRSLFWGGWSPRLTDADLAAWPADVRAYLTGPEGYAKTEEEIGVSPSTDYIVQADLYKALLGAFQAAQPSIPAITAVGEAPLAVQGASPRSGIFPFDKFSGCPFLIDAIRDDAAVDTGYGDVSRRIFLVPRAQVLRLDLAGDAVTGLEVSIAGQRQTIAVAPTCAVIVANGTIEATRLALESLGVGATTFGSPRAGNLMAHLRSNITVRVKRAALGLPSPPKELETVALIVRGTAQQRRFHLQVTASAVVGPDPEKNMWSLVPDIDLLGTMLANQDPDWVTITLRGIGEMEPAPTLAPDPARGWIDLSTERDGWGMRRAYVNLVPTASDAQLWRDMDAAAFGLAATIAKAPANIQYWNGQAWQPNPPDPNGPLFWHDGLGTTHHEAGTLFMGQAGASLTDTNGKFHGIRNAYVAGPSVFPALGSANPSLTALSLARRTADAILASATPPQVAGAVPIPLDAGSWRMVSRGPWAAGRHYGKVVEMTAATGGYGLYFFTKQPFADFRLTVDWRVGRRDDNSGVYIRTPGPDVSDPLGQADSMGHEIQIDERGFDSASGTEGHPLKTTAAIYDLAAPMLMRSNPVGSWNTFVIEARGPDITVALNGKLTTRYRSSRPGSGYIALQAHHDTSRVQFRNLWIETF